MQKYCLQRKIHLRQLLLSSAMLLKMLKFLVLGKAVLIEWWFFGNYVCDNNCGLRIIEISLPKCETFSKFFKFLHTFCQLFSFISTGTQVQKS